MISKRIIPLLLLHDGALVKTLNFKEFDYIGDPVNTIQIFNEFEVDELILVDILASKLFRKPNFKLIGEVADQCFMPFSYGGGITNLLQIERILKIGVEKVVINTQTLNSLKFIKKASYEFGSQCIIGSIDVKYDFSKKKYNIFKHGGLIKTDLDLVDWAIQLEENGVGELLISSIDRDGTWSGYDFNLINLIAENVSIPVIASGGSGSVDDINKLFQNTNCSAAGIGSLFVYQKKGMGVLINFPSKLKDE